MNFSIYDLLFWILFFGMGLFTFGVQYVSNVVMLFGVFFIAASMLVAWIIYRKYGIRIVDGHVYANMDKLR